MLTREEIENTLPQFIGTDYWHRYSPLFSNVLLTDGAKYVAESCGAYWLMDVICSHLPSVDDTFAIAMLSKFGDKWEFKLLDDITANRIYAKQTIEYSDFPLDSIKFYVIKSGPEWTILLPSEY